MSFLHDTVLPGPNRLYNGGAVDLKDGQKRLRKSQSHAGFLTPLIQLVRDPVGAIGTAVGNFNNASETGASSISAEEHHKEALYVQMRNAESYDEWKTAACELDVLEGNDAWKLEDHSTEYDAALVAARLQQLDDARLSCDVNRMLFLIRTSLTRGLGGMGDLRLYKHSHIGTKHLIERYIESAQKTLNALLDVSAKQQGNESVDSRTLLEQLLASRQSFGRSALLLSGGGTFGMNHIGVVKSLWQARLLPRIISGASAGSIVCAVLCTKIDAEIPQVLEDFCYGDLAVFEKEGGGEGLMSKVARFLKYGALFDISHLVNIMKDLLGDITFQEAYNRTRRILNITVSSASLYELPRLLNYVTAPNVMIWSAVCASCSVPFIFSAASLLAKDPRTGDQVPWNPAPNAGWIDGSVDNDLPMTRLAEMFNVNHFIVSQVNPHVVPFLMKEEENIGAEARQGNSAFVAGPGWLHSMANLAKGEALHRLHVMAEFGIFPNYLTKARSVLNQRYSGDITIFPAISYAHFPKVLSNPTTDYMLQSMIIGERATWPKLSRVQNHVAIELALDEAVRQLRARVVFSPSQIDLRLNSFNRPVSEGFDGVPRPRSSKSHRKITRFDHDTAPSGAAKTSRFADHPHSLPSQETRRLSKPYLPSHPLAKHSPSRLVNRSSHQQTVADITSSSSGADLASDTDTTDPLSSPSPPGSPSSTLPTLWPSTRQLFPSASQPSTPSITTQMPRSNSSLHLTMTRSSPRPASPSSPERRYKMLFHPPAALARGRGSLNKDTSPNVSAQPLAQMQAVQSNKSQLDAPNRTLPLPTKSLIRSLSPISSRDDSEISRKESKKERKQRKNTEKDKNQSRRGSAQGAGLGLLLDISGTRGMMMRRKKTSNKNESST